MASHPFHGWIPRKVTAGQVKKAMDGDINPFTKKSFSPEYRRLLEPRKGLPCYSYMGEFYKLFQRSQILIVLGEMACGKTTQIPQLVVYSDLPHLRGKLVACTQPCPAAAMSAAKRVASEMDVTIGGDICYTVKFEDLIKPESTFLRCITDEMMIREVMADPLLTRYSTIIVDETQKRTVATDILMSLLKNICKNRGDLKIVVMSNSLEGDKLQRYFGTDQNPAPLLKIPSRRHPVEVFYTRGIKPDCVNAAVSTVLFIHQNEPPGDILVFLCEVEEIEDACRKIKLGNEKSQTNPTVGELLCAPLYSPLTNRQQELVHHSAPPPRRPGGPRGRKVIVTLDITDVPSSVNGIVYVVDSGVSKETSYNPRIRIEMQLAGPISKARATQRAVRAGQTRPGKCFRLYTEKSFTREMEAHDTPEICRSNLTRMVLELIVIGVTDLIRHDYLESPPPETVMRALEALNYLGAIDDDGNLTQLGSTMAQFPVDPQLSKMLIVSPQFSCGNEMLTIVAMLSVPDVFVRAPNQRKEADAAKWTLSVPEGDHLTLLNVYNNYVKNPSNQKWAWSHYVSVPVLNQARKVRNGLLLIMERLDLELNTRALSGPQFYNAIRKTLVCGYFMQVAYSERQGFYKTVGDDQSVSLHPSCGLNSSHEWVLFHRCILASNCQIQTVTAIKPEWLLEYAKPYYDITQFSGQTKDALQREYNKRVGRLTGSSPKGQHGRKKRKKQNAPQAAYYTQASTQASQDG